MAFTRNRCRRALRAGTLLCLAAALPSQPATREQSIQLGRIFRGAGTQREFVAQLERFGIRAEARVEIGWFAAAERRYLGVELAPTAAQIRSLPAAGFTAWQQGWSAIAEFERRRLAPGPDDLSGYGGAAAREPFLLVTRELVAATDAQDLQRRVGARVVDGYLSLLYVPRAGQGATMYGLPMQEILALDAMHFVRWRSRFLSWVEVHTPGQSQVRRFAHASDEEFAQLLTEARDRHGSHDIARAFARAAERTGIEWEPPLFAAGKTAAVVRAVRTPSPAAVAGLAPGDRITRIEQDQVKEWSDAIFWIGAYAPGSEVLLTVVGAQTPMPRRVVFTVGPNPPAKGRRGT